MLEANQKNELLIKLVETTLLKLPYKDVKLAYSKYVLDRELSMMEKVKARHVLKAIEKEIEGAKARGTLVQYKPA